MPILVTAPTERCLEELRRSLPDLPLTYQEVGATALAALPEGYRHDRVSTDLGGGSGTWARSQDALRTWQGHRRAGADIYPAAAPLTTGTDVIVTVRLALVFVIAPCRIVYTTAGPDRFGFAYGTLTGHPERGEKAFHVTKQDDGTVSFEIVAFSRPATAATRLGGPLSLFVQTRTTNRYLDGVLRYATGSD